VRFQPRHADGVLALLPDGRADAYRPGLRALEDAAERGAEAIVKTGEAIGRDRQAAETLVEACWLHYRDLLCRAAGAGDALYCFAGGASAPARGIDEIARGLAACRDAWYAIQGNVSPRLSVEVLLSRLAPREARS
jgi:hypothetical protein